MPLEVQGWDICAQVTPHPRPQRALPRPRRAAPRRAAPRRAGAKARDAARGVAGQDGTLAVGLRCPATTRRPPPPPHPPSSAYAPPYCTPYCSLTPKPYPPPLLSVHPSCRTGAAGRGRGCGGNEREV